MLNAINEFLTNLEIWIGTTVMYKVGQYIKSTRKGMAK